MNKFRVEAFVTIKVLSLKAGDSATFPKSQVLGVRTIEALLMGAGSERPIKVAVANKLEARSTSGP
jgi:hypothetical protein